MNNQFKKCKNCNTVDITKYCGLYQRFDLINDDNVETLNQIINTKDITLDDLVLILTTLKLKYHY